MAYFTELNLAVANIWNGADDFEKLLQHLNNENCKEVIIFCHTEHDHWSWAQYNKVLDLAKSKNVPVTITNGAYEIYRTIPRKEEYTTVHVPTFWFLYSLSLLVNTKNFSNFLIPDITKLSYKYHFMSMNRLAHQHRSEMLDMLALNGLVDSNAVSWHNLEPFPYVYKFWEPKVKFLTDNFRQNNYDINSMPQEYYNSFCQLVVESDVGSLFVTEKTVYPLLLGKPFLVASCVGFHQYLESLGFQSYTELFDYSFDLEPNQTLRFSMIADNLRKLSTIPLSDLNTLAESVKEKVEYNKKMAIHYAINKDTYPDIFKRFYQVYKDTGIIVDHYTVSPIINLENFDANLKI
jgi:hypothetical protein